MTRPIPAAVIFGAMPAVIVPSETDKAYAAGFFDGEGNVCIAANLRGGAGTKYHVHNMRIGASQREAEPLVWLRDRWGGSIRRASRSAVTGRRMYYEWACFAIGAAAFLRDVLPYLQIKRERADLALKFQATSVQPGRRAHTPEHKDGRCAMKAEMNRLNMPQASA